MTCVYGRRLISPDHSQRMRFLYDPRRQKGLVWVFVAETGLTQDFWIEIVRSGGEWAIRPARGCGIVPTVGVQCALDLVRDTAQQTVLVHGARPNIHSAR